MSSNREIERLRELAKQAAAIAADPVQDERRDLWRRHNSLESTRPLIYVRAFAWGEVIRPWLKPVCTDPLYAMMEDRLMQAVFRDTIGDDFIIEPFLSLPAVLEFPAPGTGRWGPVMKELRDTVSGAHIATPVINTPDDLETLVLPRHAVNEAATLERFQKASAAIGDIFPVVIDRFPLYINFNADISTDMARLRGLEQIMLDMYENPDLLHRLAAFLRDGVLKAQDEAGAESDLSMFNSYNQAMAYSRELPDPGILSAADAAGDTQAPSAAAQLPYMWGFLAAQEFALISPEMHDEFLLQYQLPILKRFGLTSYGCCEDLTRKIDMVRQIPNLRRIAVTPWADIRSCAEQIGTDYVVSWRPSPADHISRGVDTDFVSRSVKAADAVYREYGSIYDITLKDVHTIGGDVGNVKLWVDTVRQALEI